MQQEDNLSVIFLLTPAPPNTLNFNGAHRKRKTLVAPEINISLDQSEGSVLSDDFLDTPDDLDINVDDIETPDETDSLEFLGNGNELEWEGKKLVLGERLQGLGLFFNLIFSTFDTTHQQQLRTNFHSSEAQHTQPRPIFHTASAPPGSQL